MELYIYNYIIPYMKMNIYIYIYVYVCVTICYYCVRKKERGDEGDSETIFINPHWETQGSQESSHLYLYSAFNNTNCVKATAQYQNRKIVSQ